MNAVSEMSKCLVVFIIFLFQFQFPSIHSFSTVYRHSETGRKLFGGYRIIPKPCTAKSDVKDEKPKTGICMFNYECNQRGGEMIDSCIDGFLFGVCCSLPQSLANVELENDDVLPLDFYGNTLSRPSSKMPPISGGYTQTDTPTPKFSKRPEFTSESTGFDGIFTASEDPDELIGSLVSGSKLTTVKKPPLRKPILEQYFGNQTNGGFIDNDGYVPVNSFQGADTILLNHDGTIAENDQNPDVFTPQRPNQNLPTRQTSKRPPPNKVTYGYQPVEEQTFTLNNFASTTSGLNTRFELDSTFTSMNKLTTRPFVNKFSSINSNLPALNPYMTNRPINLNEQNQAFATPVKYTKPETATTATFYKKTDPIPQMVTTARPNSPFILINDNLILLANQNNTRRPTTKIPVQPTQSTSKSSSKPIYLTSRIPVKPTTSSTTVDLDDKFPGFNYDSYSGMSRPPILISHPEGLDDGGQAISHILGILNATNPKPQVETATRPLNSDGGLSTWVSILGDETSTKNKFSKPTSGRPASGVTTTAYIHGPSFSVEANDNKPVPTVVVISSDSVNSAYYTKPTKKPSPSYTTYINNNKITSKKPNKPMSDATSRPHRPTDFYQNNVYHTGQENLINFPPVRNPDLNATALNQVEKPTIVETYNPDKNEVVQLPSGITLEVVPDSELNTIDPDEDYSDFTTPSLQEDKIQNNVHSFVEKIVNSLAGNFHDLEQVLFKNDNKTSITNANGIQLNNIQVADEGDKTTIPPNTAAFTTTRKPTKRPSTIKPPDTYDTTLLEISGSTKPKPTTKKPSTTQATTKKPTTQVLTTSTSTTPTRRPTIFTTTRRPGIITISRRPTTVTTRRPIFNRPTRPRPTPTTTQTTTTTTTTTTTEENEVFDEVTEDAVSNDEVTSTEETLTSEASTVDFRRECGVRPLVKKGGRIVGGKGSQFGYYPWQVLVRESTWLGLFTKNKCGGVLITNRYVITAAHCQPGFLASLVAVFGEYDISGELESKRSVAKNVRRVIVHRQYDPATFENDLALLELDSPVTYEEHIVPICMPKEGEDYVGRMATVTGWGRLKYGGGVPSVLQEVRVPLIENSVCQEMFQTAGHQKRIISSFLCAGYANGQKDSCEGDSGGPLMVEREDGHWVLLGTVSHGIKCAAPYLPGVYMRTTYYKPWLKSITGVST